MKNKRQKRCLTSAYLSMPFYLILDHQKGPLKAPRWQNLSKIPFGRPKAPQGRRRPPRGFQGAIWEPFGTNFANVVAILAPKFKRCLDLFWSDVGKPWEKKKLTRCLATPATMAPTSSLPSRRPFGRWPGFTAYDRVG